MVIDKDLIRLVTGSRAESGNNYGTGMILFKRDTNEVLLAKRTDTENYCTPGGKVEVGETVLAAVYRETLEESNVFVNSCKLYDYEMHTAPNGKNWVSFMFVSEDFDDSEIVNQESEVGEWKWYKVEDALNLDLFPPSRKGIERAIEMGVVDGSLSNSGDILGFVKSPTIISTIKDSECCSYSCNNEQIFC